MCLGNYGVVDNCKLIDYTFHMKYPRGIENRIKRVEGQVGGVKKMILAQESDTKVMTQLQAAISSLESLKTELIKQQMKESIVGDIKKSLGLAE